MSVLDEKHQPENFTGFTRFQLEIYERFAAVAVENALTDGNLDGTGANPDVKAHETGVVDGQTLMSQYDLPIVLTIPTGTTTEARTTGADTARLTFSVSSWVSDYNQGYGLIDAQVIIGNVVNNVEDNRTLLDANGTTPLAEDTTMTETTYDWQFNVEPQRHLKFGTADFEVRTKRNIPNEYNP